MDRVDAFLGGRLRGRSVPEDLRRLVEIQLEREPGNGVPLPHCGELRVLSPAEAHPLQKPLKIHPDDEYAEETRANERAINEVLAHVAVVASDFDGALWGYWMHPDEPPNVAPRIVKLNTEGEFSIELGDSLIEAFVFDTVSDDQAGEVIADCERQGIPFAARSSAELRPLAPLLNPVELHEKLYKRFHPNHRRPAWADETGAVPDAAPIGARSDDPRVARALALHGLPPDPTPLIRSADVGEGEVVLEATECSALFDFHRENDTAWFLNQMRFSHGKSERPPCTHVPFGLRLGETREQCRARLGEPHWKSPLGKRMEAWDFGRVVVRVHFADDTIRAVVCFGKE